MASGTRGESSNPYGGMLGTGGKLRKPTARRSQKTPYDRPPTSVWKSGLGGGEDKGWLSKLVDPAQRLISYSAHKLFASVFRKRIVSGETPSQSPDQKLPERVVNPETKVVHKEDIPALSMKNDPIRIEETNTSIDPTTDRFTNLENIFKDKTFTRSEVDRLTTFLLSKTVDSSTVNEEQRNEVSIVRHPPSHERDRVHPDNGSMNAHVSTPLGSSRGINECIASPSELAKAYMGSRTSEVTPSMLGLRAEAVREDSVFLNRSRLPLKSSTMLLEPKPSGQKSVENGFLTPRSRGKSAVYSMARTPYARHQSSVKIGSLFQPSPSTREERLSSGSRLGFQSGLKRRSSVLDNDIGSGGAIRRLRQKSNLSSRRLTLPASENPLAICASVGQKITHTCKDNAEDIPSSSFNVVPSKSSEMASKILQQLDKLVSTKEKSPSKLSPSMLQGPALKSLQNMEAPKFLDNLPENQTNSPVSSDQKQEKSRENGSRENLALSVQTGAAADDTSKAGSRKDQETLVKGAYLSLTSSLEKHPPKRRAFRMIADEDLSELDDDHGAASTTLEVAEKQNVSQVEKDVGISMPKGEKPLTLSEDMPSTSYISNGDATQATSNGSLETGRGKYSALPTEAVQKSKFVSEPTSKFIQGTEKSTISPGKLSSEEKVISREEPKKAAPVFPNIFSSAGASADIKLEKTSSSASGVSAASTVNSSIFSPGANVVSPPLNNGFLGSSPSFPCTSVSEVPCTVQSLAPTPTASSVFGKLPANTSNDSNSQPTSTPPLSSTSPFKFGEPAAPFSVSTVSVSSSQISKETEVNNSTFGNVNSFKFGGGMASANTNTANVFAKSSEIKSTTGFMFGNSSPAVADTGSNIFGGTSSVVSSSTLNSSAAASSAPGSSSSLLFGVTSFSTPATDTSKLSAAPTQSNSFGTSSPAFTSSGSSMFGGVAASTPNSVFGFNAASSASTATTQSQTSNPQMSNTVSGTTITTQSLPFQFASAPSFGLSGNISSSSSPFGLSKSEPATFASGSIPQLSSTSSPMFGTNWQAPSSAPAFSSAFTTSSPTFSFGGSSAATGSSASAPIFGASTNTPSSSPIFGFSSIAPSTSQQQVFGNSAVSAPTATPLQSPFSNSTSGFAFGGAASPNGFNNNQQMSMEDTMAEDTDQANKTSLVQPMFGQQAVSMPQQTFGFGGAPVTAPPASVANPFQFGGQPIANPGQNASSFQSSQNLEFQGSGSFSLGSMGSSDKAGRRIYKAKKTNRKK